MASLEKYRRTWFSMLKAAGIAPEDRHAVQESLTGKASTKSWGKRDFDTAIAALQRDLGQHEDARAHVRADREFDMASEPGDWASDEQCEFIEALCDQIAWRVGRHNGPAAYVAKHFFSGEESELRRRLLWQGKGAGRWKCLTRQEASAVIQALQAMTQAYPVEASA